MPTYVLSVCAITGCGNSVEAINAVNSAMTIDFIDKTDKLLTFQMVEHVHDMLQLLLIGEGDADFSLSRG